MMFFIRRAPITRRVQQIQKMVPIINEESTQISESIIFNQHQEIVCSLNKKYIEIAFCINYLVMNRCTFRDVGTGAHKIDDI